MAYNSDSLLETLKRIDFPEVDKYTSADFDAMFAHKELMPLLENLCSLNEENVLSSEELEEYAAISPAELSHLEKLAEEGNIMADESEDERRQELLFLQKHLSLIEETNKSLERQRDLLMSHENLLLKEKDYCRNVLSSANRRFQTYKVQRIPQIEMELVSVLQSISVHITELETLITNAYDESKLFPASVFKDMDNYFEEERKILDHIQVFLQKSFEVENNKMFVLKVPGLEHSRLLREVHFMRQALKNSKMAMYEAGSEKRKMDTVVDFYKNYKDGMFPQVFEISTSQMWSKLQEENKYHEHLKERENTLKLHLSKEIAEHVNVQCNKIGIARSEEIIQCHNSSLEKLQGPLEQLVNQRSRMEMVILYLDSYKRTFENIKDAVDSTSSYLKSEKDMLIERMNKYDEELHKEVAEPNTYLPENSILFSVLKILSDVNQSSFVTLDDVMKKVTELYDKKREVEKQWDENIQVLTLMEQQTDLIEKFVFRGKEFSNLTEMDMDFYKKLSRLDAKLEGVQHSLSEHQQSMDEEKKLLERKQNLQLARCLYIYALMDRTQFENCIEKIKVAAEHSNVLNTSPL